MYRERMGILFIVIIWMEIPNYEIIIRKKQLIISNNYMTICLTDVLGC